MTLFPDVAAGGLATVCRAWALVRADGLTLGFTDHDLPLTFEGITFRPDAGLSARALVQGTGLAVDNTEVMGALSDAAITEADIEAGRYDGAEVRLWLVDWRAPEQRSLRFRGNLGEIRRGQGAFHAELRGLTERLNVAQGRVFHRDCAAVLGDAACGVDLDLPTFAATFPAPVAAEAGRVFVIAGLDAYADRWFERGTLTVLSGAGAGLRGLVKGDRLRPDATRRVELWEPLRATVAPGDLLRLTAGCDRRAVTCRFKFDNIANFRGFPFLPGDDWMIAGPRRDGAA